MAIEVLMPRQGQSVESCVIVEWKKKEGDRIQKGEVLCEVETDKAVFAVEAPEEGALLKILFPQGADVPVLSPIAYIGKEGEIPAEQPIQQPSPVEKILPRQKAYRISPRALKLAKKSGITPETIAGSGPKGRIIERDIQRALEKKVATPHAIVEKVAVPHAKVEIVADHTNLGEPSRMESIPVTGSRKVIAQRMMESLQSHAQFTLHTTADARKILHLRTRYKESPESFDCRGITINDLVLFAVAHTLPKFIELNALWEKSSIQRSSVVDLGVAVDTSKGLMVPVIRNAQALTLLKISKEAKRLAQTCLDGKVKPEELQGGTFTVTNLGNLGIHSFTPILNSPQVAILGVSDIQLQPVLEGETVQFHPHLGLSLTVDHQAVDGAPAARFLKHLAEAITNFDLLLAG